MRRSLLTLRSGSAFPMLVALGDGRNVWSSRDGGASWSASPILAFSPAVVLKVGVWMPTRKRLWVAGDAGAYAYSDDYGVNWTTGSFGSPNVLKAAYNDASDTLVVALATTGNSKMQVSTNGGFTWGQSATTVVGSSTQPSAMRYVNGYFIVGFANGTAAYSTTGATNTWTGTSFPSGNALTDFAYIGGTYYANTAGVGAVLVQNATPTGVWSGVSNEAIGTYGPLASTPTVVLIGGDNRTMSRVAGGGNATTINLTSTGMTTSPDITSIAYSPSMGRAFAVSSGGHFIRSNPNDFDIWGGMTLVTGAPDPQYCILSLE